MKNLYVVEFNSGMVKIGIADNVKKRIASIRTAAGIVSPAKKVFTIQDDAKTITKIEQAVLTLLAKHKTNGEWLSIDFDSAVEMVKETQFAVEKSRATQDDCFDAFISNIVGKTRVSLTDIAAAINKQRKIDGKPLYQLGSFLSSKSLAEYIEAASKEWNMQPDEMLTRSGKASGSTVAHVSVGILLLESADMTAKAKIHKAMIEDWNNKLSECGGTEFFKLNAALSALFGDNENEFINIAKTIRERILGSEAKTEDWNVASVAQTHLRYEWENKLCDMLRLGVVRDYDHIKQLIHKL